MDADILINNSISQLFGKKAIDEFEQVLLLNNSRYSTRIAFIRACVMQGTLCMILGIIMAGAYVKTRPEAYIGLGILGFILPFFGNILFQDILFEKRKREKEAQLPDMLLEASIFCDENSFLHTIQKISEGDFGGISTDFRRAMHEIQKGASITESLERIKKLNKSKVYSRVIDLLLQGYESGIPLSSALQETAEDILENQTIQKERSAVLLVTKYTLLGSAGIIVPALIGVMTGLVSGLDMGSVESIGFGLESAERKALFETAKLGALIYIAEYALLASYFLSLIENNKKNTFVYAIGLLPLALIIFLTAQTFL